MAEKYIIYILGSGAFQDIQKPQEFSDLLADIADGYPTILAMGGAVVPVLAEIAANSRHKLQNIAQRLLKDIAQTTTRQLAPQASQLLCPDCLVCYSPHQVSFSWRQPTLTYYGCQNCGQSREFLNTSVVVATLDSQAQSETVKKGEVWQVNWLTRRRLFDFSMVEIIQASDEDVERFAAQVGNDTDPKRQTRYKDIACVVAPTCVLSENTLRVLQRMFGEVVT